MATVLRAALAVSVLLGLDAAPAAAAAKSWTILRTSVELPGTVLQVRPADVDGDGHADLVALHRHEKRRLVSVVCGDGGGKLEPGEPVEAPPDAVFCDTAELDGRRGEEISFLGPQGVTALRREGRRLREPGLIVTVPSIALAPQEDQLLFGRFAEDFDGDGQDELLVQDFRGVRLLERDAAGSFTIAAELPVAVKAAVHSLLRDNDRTSPPGSRVTYTAQPVEVADLDGDGRQDLAFLWRDRLTAFLQTPAGFQPQAALLRDFGLLQDDDPSVEPVLTSRLTDLDGDGLADLLFGQDRWGGAGKKPSQLWWFRGQRGAGGLEWPEQPTQSFSVGDSMTATMRFDDYDRNGRRDLVMLAHHFGLMSIVRILISRGMTFQAHIHTLDAEGRLATRPVEGTKLGLKLEFSGGSGMPLIEYADFDGDGRRDLCYGTGNDELSWYLGGRKGLEDRAAAIAKVSPYASAITARLGGGPGEDLVLWYPNKAKLAGRVEVFVDAPAARP